MTDGQQWGPPPPAGQGGPEQPGSQGYGTGPGYPQQPPYGQPPYQPQPYGPPQPGYGHPAYGPPTYGRPYYGQPHPGYAPQGYGSGGYGGPGYGRPGVWPYGPGRPPVATTAAVLGFVTGGLTALGGLFFLLAATGGDGDAATAILMLGLPCAVGLITGAVQVVQRRSAAMLFWSAIAAVGVLGLALVVGMTALDEDDGIGVAVFVFFACILPVVTAVLARLHTVTEWLAAARY